MQKRTLHPQKPRSSYQSLQVFQIQMLKHQLIPVGQRKKDELSIRTEPQPKQFSKHQMQ